MYLKFSTHGLLGKEAPSTVLSLLSKSSIYLVTQCNAVRVKVRPYFVVHGFTNLSNGRLHDGQLTPETMTAPAPELIWSVSP